MELIRLVSLLSLCLIGFCATSLLELQNAQSSIENSTSPFCYSGHSGTRQSFLSKRWYQHFGGNLALVYPFCLTTNELGNKLGNYFNEIACAHISGLHFIAVHKQFELLGSHHNSNISTKEKLHFLNALPTVIMHPNPSDETTAKKLLNEKCQCTRYCWQDSNAPWVKALPLIGSYIREASKNYYLSSGVSSTIISPDVDITNAHAADDLPVVPDVAIQYRCGDNIGFSYMYGILPFYAFPSRIPEDAKYIYVLSDHPSRASHSPYSSRCQLILQHLFEYLREKRPQAIILIKRGGDLFLDYYRLTYARVTICSASSYCLWPAIANEGTAHFPVSSLVAGVDTIELAVNMTHHFHWIDEPKIISNFKGLRPWTMILDVLTGKAPMPV